MDKSKRLPDKVSDLIRAANRDLLEVAQDPRYRLYAHDWHQVHPKADKCSICYAGAVMAGALGADPERTVMPVHFDHHTEVRLLLLDHLRSGSWYAALESLNEGSDDPAFWPDELFFELAELEGEIPYFSAETVGNFVDTMEMIAAIFEKHGL